MPLSVGDKLGPYEILALIGEGGMGEVYKATDPRLNRTVALKVSKTEFSERFEREATAVAALNHPHICQVYDVGPNYLVLEYIDGAPLTGPLPLEKALEYAGQIASALDAAHSRKITHRDLKPANMLVTKQGVKLLDFGLAKIENPVALDGETITMGLTAKGQILGTLLYMAPEQLHGQEISPRTDIFAFGLVLYEMLTGRRAFDGSSAASVIAAILERPAPSIADIATPALDRLLKRCLEKDPEQRWQSARDLRAALDLAAIPARAAQPVTIPAARPASKLPWIGAAVFAIAAVAALWAPWRTAPPAPLEANLTITLPDGASLGEIAIAPNGRTLAYVALFEGERRIFLRPLDRAEAQPLKGTEDALTLFWAPDSRQIGFFTSQAIKKVEVTTGVGSTIYTLSERVASWDSGTWAEDGTILFSLNPPTRSANVGLYRISNTGGRAIRVTTIDQKEGEVWHTRPLFLPGGRRFLYTILSNQGGAYTGIYVGSLDSAEKKRVVRGPSRAVYAPSSSGSTGRLYFSLAGANPVLSWQVFNPTTSETSGEPVQVVDQMNANYANSANVSVSNNGILVFHSSGNAPRELRWFGRDGRPGEAIPGGFAVEFSLSDDERKLIGPRNGPSAGVTAPARRSIWMLDFARAGASIRLTFNESMEDRAPQFSPDGSRFIFYRKAPGAPKPTDEYKVFMKSANGTGQEELLLKTDPTLVLDQWSPKGNFLVYGVTGQQTGPDLWVLPLTGNDRIPKPYAQTESGEVSGRLSPDERWMAYCNIVGGSQQVVVRPFPNFAGGQWQVSLNGGDRPVWSADGKDLFFLAPDGKLMSVEVTLPFGTGTPAFGQPKLLFQTDGDFIARSGYAASRDAQRFLFIANSTSSQPITVLMNMTPQMP